MIATSASTRKQVAVRKQIQAFQVIWGQLRLVTSSLAAILGVIDGLKAVKPWMQEKSGIAGEDS